MDLLHSIARLGPAGWLIVAGAVLFDFANGWNDAGNAIATAVCTRVLRPAVAVAFGAILNFLGAMWSSEVAKTVGKEIADPAVLTTATYLAALFVAPIWIGICSWRGLPISCSHSLMGALVGAVMATAGPSMLRGEGLRKILFGVFCGPFFGFGLGLLVVTGVCWLFKRARPSQVNAVFGKLQIVSAGAMAFAHGTGDAQKAMGIITGALIAGTNQDWHISPWVRVICASAMAAGTAIGSWAVIRTLGTRLSHLRTYQGFAAETGAAMTIILNTSFGIPLSTTHSITGSIMGVGSAHGLRTVRWGVGRKIVYAWLLTFPVCIAGGWLGAWLLSHTGIGAPS
jgi:inorganic phosphate transporter, PiT family